ncbi:MAG: glutathione S-transferase family protein, partial [Myxococcales bacterium]|nr:glutathione S-transferase family protein [Myxococcales bacterium]
AAEDRLIEDLVSPYSAKLRAYLAFRGLPYRRIRMNVELYLHTVPKLVGFPIMPVMLTADGRVMQDSTPIIQHLERERGEPHPATVPPDPALAFVMWLLEDFADEYMPRLIMHTRWGTAEGAQTLARRIARRLSWSKPDTDLEQLTGFVLARQRGFDRHLGINDDTRPDLDAQLRELLTLLDARLSEHRFLLGDRPSVADFALYGPLWAHGWMDPSSAGLLERHGPRTCDWLDVIAEFGDVRGRVCPDPAARLGDWLRLEDAPTSLGALLTFVARTHLPYARAGARASVTRQKRYRATVRGIETEFSTHHYRAWSFEQVQLGYQALSDEDRARVDPLLTRAEILPGLFADGVHHNALYDGLTPPFIVDGVGDNRVAHHRRR